MNHNIKNSIMESDVLATRQEIVHALLNSPIPHDELLRNLGLYLLPMDLKRLLFFDSLYKQFIDTPGIICEFGCRWGQNLSILQSLRAIYEPYNHFRTIVGFDTFEGLRGVTENDGSAGFVTEGSYGVSEKYEDYLEKLLVLKESQSAMAHMKKFLVIKGDAPIMFNDYLQKHPETIISFAYFDMDIYEPTLKCLDALKRHLTKGSIVGFDELIFADFPGETQAFQEIIGANKVRLRRNQWCGTETFFVVE